MSDLEPQEPNNKALFVIILLIIYDTVPFVDTMNPLSLE